MPSTPCACSGIHTPVSDTGPPREEHHAHPQPRPQKPYPATLPAPTVSYSRNVMDDFITEVTFNGDTHILWTGSRGIASNFRGSRSEYFNTLAPEDQAALIAWAEDVHERAAMASPELQADLIGE